ncbi:MAG TPA: phosphoheptose isomerase [Desulfobacteraceae bacterium]|nr:phosphoheptose isomerase [Desulfobacteraceae bacterium]
MEKYIIASLNEAKASLTSFIKDDKNIAAIQKAAEIAIITLENKNTIYSCGNGGSMSDAIHFAEELTGKYRKNRAGLAAAAISDPGHISCVANDFGYEYIFSRYLEARAKKGDSLLAISTSGQSKNVIQAAQYAKEHGISIISLTGTSGSELGKISTVDICTLAGFYADRVQELHIKVIHILIELIERKFFPANYDNLL